MTKLTTIAAACLLLSCAGATHDDNSTIVVEFDRSIASASEFHLSYVVPIYTCPDTFLECGAEDPQRERFVFRSSSGEAGPPLDVVARAFERPREKLGEQSAPEEFWGELAFGDSEIARVGIRTRFVTGETRFLRLKPTRGCLQSLDSIPTLDPTLLGRDERPLVLDGCDEQSNLDAGTDSGFDQDADAW